LKVTTACGRLAGAFQREISKPGSARAGADALMSFVERNRFRITP
jgi:hypothetical protein